MADLSKRRRVADTLVEWSGILDAKQAFPILMIGGWQQDDTQAAVLLTVESVGEREAIAILREMVRRLEAKGVQS